MAAVINPPVDLSYRRIILAHAMRGAGDVREGQILIGPLFNERMRGETVRRQGPGVWVVGFVGVRSERFRSVALTSSPHTC